MCCGILLSNAFTLLKIAFFLDYLTSARGKSDDGTELMNPRQGIRNVLFPFCLVSKTSENPRRATEYGSTRRLRK